MDTSLKWYGKVPLARVLEPVKEPPPQAAGVPLRLPTGGVLAIVSVIVRAL